MSILIGTSGWQYKHWRAAFYPAKLAQSAWLEHFAERFATVELNNSFYRLPEAETFAAWKKRTPDDFVFAVKASRYLTHIKRLKDPEEPVTRMMERAKQLGPKLGPVLIQLPPTLKVDVASLDATLAAFPKKTRLAVEFRHDSWFVDEVKDVLTARGAAFCLADRDEKTLGPVWKTTEWTFMRFHAGVEDPLPCYSRETLERWASVLGEWADEDVFVYFNNDTSGCAIRDAVVFAQICDERGVGRTRVPALEEAPVG